MLDKKDPEPSLQELKNDTLDAIKECRDLRQSIRSQRSVKLKEPLPDLRSTIPSKEECDELVHCYLRTVELLYRVVHIPSFWMEYEAFWRQPPSSSSPFLIKLVLILAIGTIFRPRDRNRDDYDHLVQKWTYAAQWWLVGPSGKSTSNLDGLQVMCLLLIARKTCGLGASPWLSAGSLMQAAVTMGLHRDPSNFPSLSRLQAEMRLRLWATVLELALQESLDSATPVMIPANFDTSAPSNVDDKDLGPNTTSDSMPELNERLTDASAQVLLHDSARLRMRVLEVMHDCQGQSYQEALELGRQLRAVCRKVAAYFRSARNRGQFSSTLGLGEFHASFIDVHLHQYILALYTPFMVQAMKDPHYYYARKACLESGRIIASYADSLHLASEVPDDLLCLFVSGKGSFKGPLSLDVISSLGLELVTQLEEEYVPCLPGLEGDSLDGLADANRDHLIETLEHIRSQLFHIIAGGTPSMKRFGLLAAVLGQIRAMKAGKDVTQTVYETVIQSFKDCHSVLQQSATPSEGAIEGLSSGSNVPGAFDISEPTLSDISMDLGDAPFDIDLQSLFPSDFNGSILSLFG
ncbi:hypothetical protein BDW62DRAFT_100874 [Aspergillus aurantiobrunneus]